MHLISARFLPGNAYRAHDQIHPLLPTRASTPAHDRNQLWDQPVSRTAKQDRSPPTEHLLGTVERKGLLIVVSLGLPTLLPKAKDTGACASWDRTLGNGSFMQCTRVCAEVCALPNTLVDPSLVQPPAHALGRPSFITLYTPAVTLGDILASSLGSLLCTPMCTQEGPSQPSKRLEENHQIVLSPAPLCRLAMPSFRLSEPSLLPASSSQAKPPGAPRFLTNTRAYPLARPMRRR